MCDVWGEGGVGVVGGEQPYVVEFVGLEGQVVGAVYGSGVEREVDDRAWSVAGGGAQWTSSSGPMGVLRPSSSSSSRARASSGGSVASIVPAGRGRGLR